MTDREFNDMPLSEQENISDRLVCSVIEFKDLQDNQVQEFCLLKNQHWPYSLQEQRRWWDDNSEQRDLLVRLVDGEYLWAFLRLRMREIICEGAVYATRCVTEVCVAHSALRKGLGRRLMDETMHVLDQESTPLGYLLCTTAQEQFYKQCGWLLISDVRIRASASEVEQILDEKQRCFVYDPAKLLRGSVLLTGRLF